MGNTIDTTRSRKLYGSFRAYCFFNFVVLGLMALAVGLTQLGTDTEFGAGLIVIGLIGVGIGYLFWLPVAKRVQPTARNAVFLNFCLTGLLAFGKVLLACTVILIPLAIKIASNPYEEMLITTGPNAGETVPVRYIGNGEYRDIDGKIYRSR